MDKNDSDEPSLLSLITCPHRGETTWHKQELASAVFEKSLIISFGTKLFGLAWAFWDCCKNAFENDNKRKRQFLMDLQIIFTRYVFAQVTDSKNSIRRNKAMCALMYFTHQTNKTKQPLHGAKPFQRPFLNFLEAFRTLFHIRCQTEGTVVFDCSTANVMLWIRGAEWDKVGLVEYSDAVEWA